MNRFLLMEQIFVILLTVNEIKGINITGPHVVNFTKLLNKIWMKGIGLIPNLLPDVTFNDKTRERKPGGDAAVGRRVLKEVIAGHRKKIEQDNKEFISYDFTNYDDDPAFVKISSITAVSDNRDLTMLKYREINDLISIDRRKQGKIDEKLLVREQHDQKVKKIKAFMEENYLATDYFYNEVQRIKKERRVMDTLRHMVEFLSQPGMDELNKAVFKCFHDERVNHKIPGDIWKNRIPNNLVINTVKDPYNYGFMN